jgi:hypothetical protein
MKRGRPSDYSPELVEAICAGIAEGLLLPGVCKRPGMPSPALADVSRTGMKNSTAIDTGCTPQDISRAAVGLPHQRTTILNPDRDPEHTRLG